MKTAHILLTASAALAMAFTFSCSSGDDDNENSSSSISSGGNSSSSGGNSSSSGGNSSSSGGNSSSSGVAAQGLVACDKGGLCMVLTDISNSQLTLDDFENDACDGTITDKCPNGFELECPMSKDGAEMIIYIYKPSDYYTFLQGDCANMPN